MCVHNGGMTNTATNAARRPAVAADLVKGAIVYKGQGKVAYRVWAVNSYGKAGLVKATTEQDPTRSTWWGTDELTVEIPAEVKPSRAERIAAAVEREAARCAAAEVAKAQLAAAVEPHGFTAKGSAKASACASCGRTWNAAAHRAFRAAASA